MQQRLDSKNLPTVMIVVIIGLLGILLQQKIERGDYTLSVFNSEHGTAAETVEPSEAALTQWDQALERREEELRRRAMAEYERLRQERASSDKGRLLLERAFALSNVNTGFGVHVEASGIALVYEHVVEVVVENAVLYRGLPTIGSNPAVYVSGVEMGLGRWVEYDEGRWSSASQSLRFPIDQTLSHTNERITLTGLTFSIPFETQRPIEEHWLLMGVVSPSEHGDGYYYAHTVPTLFK